MRHPLLKLSNISVNLKKYEFDFFHKIILILILHLETDLL